MEKLTSLGLLAFALILAGCCTSHPSADPSSAFVRLDPATLVLLSLPEAERKKEQSHLLPNCGSTPGRFFPDMDGSCGYLSKDYNVEMPLAKSQQGAFFSAFEKTCLNRITGFGTISKGSGTRDTGTDDSAFSVEEFYYNTPRTTGKIRLEGFAMGESKFRLVIVIFECRRTGKASNTVEKRA